MRYKKPNYSTINEQIKLEKAISKQYQLSYSYTNMIAKVAQQVIQDDALLSEQMQCINKWYFEWEYILKSNFINRKRFFLDVMDMCDMLCQD